MKVDCRLKSLVVRHDLEQGDSTFQIVAEILGEIVTLNVSPTFVSKIESLMSVGEPAPVRESDNWSLAELEDSDDIEQV